MTKFIFFSVQVCERVFPGVQGQKEEDVHLLQLPFIAQGGNESQVSTHIRIKESYFDPHSKYCKMCQDRT